MTGSNEEKLRNFADELASSDGKLFTYKCDIRDRSQVEAMVQKAAAEAPPIDILINNVSLPSPSRVLVR